MMRPEDQALDSEACPQKGIKLTLTLTVEENSNDKSIDTEDTRHDNWDDGLEEELWLQDDCTADADSRLGSSVGGSEVSKDQGSCDAHVSEERVLVAIVI